MKCPTCGKDANRLTGGYCNGEMHYVCNHCEKKDKYLHSLKNCDTFNAHYDLQLDTFIESKEHKAKILKEKGLQQVSGTASPRKVEGVGRIPMTHGQYETGKHKL